MSTYAYLGQPVNNNATGTMDFAYLGQPFVGNLGVVAELTADISLTTVLPTFSANVSIDNLVIAGITTLKPDISGQIVTEISVLSILTTVNPVIFSDIIVDIDISIDLEPPISGDPIEEPNPLRPVISSLVSIEVDSLISLLTTRPDIVALISNSVGVQEAENNWKIVVHFTPKAVLVLDKAKPFLVLDADSKFLIRD